MGLQRYTKEHFDELKTGDRPAWDFAWFAVDSVGALAVFHTAGFARFPEIAVHSHELLIQAYDLLESLPFLFENSTPNPGPDSHPWRDWARRGFYVYDWDHCLGQYARLPYRLQESPRIAVSIANVPPALQSWLSQVEFSKLTFAESSQILVEEHLLQLL